MLRDGDGGAAVHGLQVALDRMGFNPGKEDMQWWQFGDSTYGALQTMQVGLLAATKHLPGKQLLLHLIAAHSASAEVPMLPGGDLNETRARALQACSHLPETGVADESTWKVLLGADAQPSDIGHLLSGNENDVDMTEESQDHGVWLVGEQRFSKQRL